MIRNHMNSSVMVYSVSEAISTTTEELTKTLSTTAWIRCKIRPITNTESYFQNKFQNTITHKMYTTYSASIEDQILYDSSYYLIKGTNNPFNLTRFYEYNLELVK